MPHGKRWGMTRIIYFHRKVNVSFCRNQVSRGHLQAAKNPNLSVEVLCVRVVCFPGRPTYRHGVGTVRRTVPAVIRYV